MQTVKLCHGTSWKNFEHIREHGILPRGDKPSLWDECPSHPNRVYLSNAYSFHFAHVAAKDDDLLIVEVEVDKKLLYPDEDFLGQSSPEPVRKRMPNIMTRTQFFRDVMDKLNPDVIQDMATLSLERIGNVSHRGKITPDHIRRMVRIPANQVVSIIMQEFDPTITIMNYKFLGPVYRSFQESLFMRYPLVE